LNPNIIHQHFQQYGSKCQIEPGLRAPEFEPCAKNWEFGAENGEVKITNGEVEAKNRKTHNNKVTSKENFELAKKYSNHIEFVDYIPTHEVITYRHLFAYGFYVE